MPLETKDKIHIMLSLLAMTISLLTFTVVQHRESVEKTNREARLLKSMYNLGTHMESARQAARDLSRASSDAMGYRNQLERMLDSELTLVQMMLDQWELKVQTNKFGSTIDAGANFVAEAVRGRHGSRAATAYDLGMRVQTLYRKQSQLLHGTETLAKCESEDVQTALSEQVRKDDSNTAPPGPTLCEWSFLYGFASAVMPLNNEIEELGGPVQIDRHPKTMQEANEALGSALGALQTKWER